MTNNNSGINNEATVEGMGPIPVINSEDITNAGGKKMKIRKTDMKKYVKPAIIFGAGAATCYVGVKVVPSIMAKRAAKKAAEVVAETAAEAAVETVAEAIVTTAATAATAMI